MAIDLLILVAYGVMGLLAMLLVTDGDHDKIRLFFTGFCIAGIGVLIAIGLVLAEAE